MVWGGGGESMGIDGLDFGSGKENALQRFLGVLALKIKGLLPRGLQTFYGRIA